MLLDTLHIIAHSLLLIADGKPLDEFSCARSRAFSDILKSFIREGCRFQAVGEQLAHHVVGKEFHAAVGVVIDKPLPRTQQLVRNHERTNGIVSGAPARVTNNVRVAFGQSGELGRIKPRIHAGENGKVSRRRHREPCFIAKIGGVSLVRCKYFWKNVAHNCSLFGELINTFVLSKAEGRHLWLARFRIGVLPDQPPTQSFAFSGNYRSNRIASRRQTLWSMLTKSAMHKRAI